MTALPTDHLYSEEHEWVNTTDVTEGATVRVGITHIAAEALGEIVCHAWALNGGNNEALIRWFREPMNALDGQTPASMVRAGRLQVLLLVLRQQAQWELPRRSA